MPVQLVWSTPDGDGLIAHMARVSNPVNQDNKETAPKLIRYLIDHRHWSPFEMVNLCLRIETTRDIGRQILRHRSFSFQEFSQRYQSIDSLPEAPLRDARLQDKKNRQNSIELPEEQADIDRWFRNAQTGLRNHALQVYDMALANGIAKEVARAVLPEGLTTSVMFMNGTLRSWIHFLEVRTKKSAQKEVRELAEEAYQIIIKVYPETGTAINSYLSRGQFDGKA